MWHNAQMIQEDMVAAGVEVHNLRWQFMIPLTIIDGDGEYVLNPCSLLHD
jgi:hypothetical protein